MDHYDEALHMRRMFAAVYAVIVVVVVYVRLRTRTRAALPRQPSSYRDLCRNSLMHRILYSSETSAIEYLRMGRGPFFSLATLLRNGDLLRDTVHCPIEEQLAMFLHTVGHCSKNRVTKLNFVRSGETVSRYFNAVLGAICAIRDQFVKQPGPIVPPEILNDPRYFPWFKDCIGLIDGTHIPARVPQELSGRFRGRKDITQNVLAVASPNKQFTYVLAGWEGSANDFIVLKDALSLPPPVGLKVIPGKYYLADAGYTTMPGFIAPYRGVRYHLKEQHGQTPNNYKELFNLRHSSLRSKIECAFGILKNRFKVLMTAPYFPLPSQVDIVLACCVLHNYIAQTDPSDPFLNENIELEDEDDTVFNEPSVFDASRSQREIREERELWVQIREEIATSMWVDYCRVYRREHVD